MGNPSLRLSEVLRPHHHKGDKPDTHGKKTPDDTLKLRCKHSKISSCSTNFIRGTRVNFEEKKCSTEDRKKI